MLKSLAKLSNILEKTDNKHYQYHQRRADVAIVSPQQLSTIVLVFVSCSMDYLALCINTTLVL